MIAARGGAVAGQPARLMIKISIKQNPAVPMMAAGVIHMAHRNDHRNPRSAGRSHQREANWPLIVLSMAMGLGLLGFATFWPASAALKAGGLGLGVIMLALPLGAAGRSRLRGEPPRPDAAAAAAPTPDDCAARLDALRGALVRIAGGDLDIDLPGEGDDAFGLLARQINALAAHLKSTRTRTEAREQIVIDTMGQIIEGRSHETANHMARVGAMSYELAVLAGLPADEAEMLRVAAPLHDLGKVGIPDAILNKPGKYTPREYAVMKAHANLGHRILARSERPMLKAAAVIALTHHERWDGLGYPRQLKGEDIPIAGRIVGLIDVFDAMFSHRRYRRAMPMGKALGIIKTQRGHHFDPRLTDLFLAHLPRFQEILDQYRDAEPDPVADAEPAADEDLVAADS